MKFFAFVAATSAINLNSEYTIDHTVDPNSPYHPDYYGDKYSETWKYAEEEHLVNETAYTGDVPTGDYSDPWNFDEGAFAGSTSTSNTLSSFLELDAEVNYLRQQHTAKMHQDFLDNIMLLE